MKNSKNIKIFYCIIFLVISNTSTLFAKTEIVYASYKYIMGDNDTKNDAKRLCFIEAKRLCLEKTGTYIESNIVVNNDQITTDEIKTYSAAFLNVEIESEKVEFIGESNTIFMTVKAKVDV